MREGEDRERGKEKKEGQRGGEIEGGEDVCVCVGGQKANERKRKTGEGEERGKERGGKMREGVKGRSGKHGRGMRGR